MGDAASGAVVGPVVTRRTWLATVVLLVAAFMELMDISMANVAGPSIRDDIGASYSQLQWVVAGYSLAFAVGLLTGGRLGDIYGRRRMFLTGLVGFLTASLLCGMAVNPQVLVAGRVLQGLAAAVMLPQVLASISVWFPKDQRAAAFGLFGAVTGIGGIAAPLVAGLLIDADILSLAWRPIFLINLPIGLAVLAAAIVLVAESKSPARLRLDPVGALVGAAAVFLLVFPVIQGQSYGWPAWSWVMIAAALPTLLTFITIERRRQRRGQSPMVNLALFADRGFSSGLLITVVFFGGVTAMAFVLMIGLQSGLGYGALRAGLALIPLAAGLILGSGLSIGLSKRIGLAVLQFGCVVAAGSGLWLAHTVGAHSTALTVWHTVPPLTTFGVGLGLVVAPLSDFVLARLPSQDTGAGTGLQSTMIQLGNATGVAVLGSLLLQDLNGGTPWPTALQHAIYYNTATFVATAVLVFLLPTRQPRPQPEPAN